LIDVFTLINILYPLINPQRAVQKLCIAVLVHLTLVPVTRWNNNLRFTDMYLHWIATGNLFADGIHYSMKLKRLLFEIIILSEENFKDLYFYIKHSDRNRLINVASRFTPGGGYLLPQKPSCYWNFKYIMIGDIYFK
jgi:hypothetical protein